MRINGRRDDTLNFIRRGVEPSGDALLIATNQTDGRKSFEAYENNPFKPDRYLFPSIMHGKASGPLEGDILETVKQKSGPYNRLHTRLIMETYGLPLPRFRSLTEVVGTLHDSIQGRSLFDLHNPSLTIIVSRS